jgi:NodT family efflux transporter outer membrane factor (OMF) lipoprotein
MTRRSLGFRVRLAVLAAAGPLAAACMVGPDYKQPPITAPAAFKEPAPADWKKAEPSDTLQKGKWWEIFGDPQLNALEEQVSVSNQSVAQAMAQYQAARAAAWGARAGLFPTVTAQPNVSSSRGTSRLPETTTTTATGTTTSGSTITVVTPSASTTTIYEVPVDVSYEVDLWGRVRRLIESDVAAAQASAGDLETMRLSMQAELAVDYFSLHGTDAQKQLLDSTATAYEKALDLTTNRYKQGIASGVDVAQAQTQLETTRAQSIDLEVQRTQFEHAVAVLVGKPPAEMTIGVSPITVPAPQVPIALPSELLERRPDIAAAERRVAAANAQIGVQKAAYYPTLSLSASGGFENTSLTNLFSWPNRFWSLGAAALQTIFDGGAISASVAQAKATYDAQVAAYRQQVLSAFQDVEDNLAAMRVLEHEARQQAAAVAAAEKSLSLSNSRYQGGITTYLEVITAQAAALANEVTAVNIQTRRMTAAVNLVKALGGGWATSDLPSGASVLSRSASYAVPGAAPAPAAPPAAANPQAAAPQQQQR